MINFEGAHDATVAQLQQSFDKPLDPALEKELLKIAVDEESLEKTAFMVGQRRAIFLELPEQEYQESRNRVFAGLASLVDFLKSTTLANERIRVFEQECTRRNGLPSVFISYAAKDIEFAELLYARLDVWGCPIWFAPRKMEGGKPISDQLVHAIKNSDFVLAVLSADSIKSSWVNQEILHALKHANREGKKKLYPIRICSYEALGEWTLLDPDTGQDHGRSIADLFIPDFSEWRNPAVFARAFDSLVRALGIR
jgi:hypothetical protein